MIFQYKNLPIHYTLQGKGEKTLLFVHGAFINKEYWAEQVKYFSNDYQIVTLDLPGHGASGKDRSYWTMEVFGEDVCALIKELQLKNVILIGHSMGGDVILEAASRCPEGVIGFIGVDNFKNAASPMPDKIQTQIDMLTFLLKINFANTCETFARKALLTKETGTALADRVVKDFRSMEKESGIEIITGSFNYWERQRELMQKLSLKMFLINVDYIPTDEELLKKYAASGYEVFPVQGTCHYPMIEDAAQFNKVLESVLEKIG
ncbi:MAG TPA: alpha/beta hydrolase [Bacteroidales bacterium]|nr:alpha/beta hydrolase [Bacteroidales bacterium]